jgi:hypothetical protein
MRRFLFLVGGLLAVTASAIVLPDIASAANLTAAQIVSKNVAARGGLKAWRAVHTLTLSGRLEAGGKENETLPFVMKMKRPRLSRLEISFEGKTAQQVYDGKQGWKVRPFLGRDEVESFTPTEAKAAKEWQELDGPLVDYAKKGIKVKLQGTESVEGYRTYKLMLTMKDGEEKHVWIDAKSFLERKIDGEPRMMDGKLRKVDIFYRDYKTENGLTIPRVLETVIDGGKQPHKMYVERVAINQSMENALFAKPNLAVARVSMQSAK